jgi:hypothetical protein
MNTQVRCPLLGHRASAQPTETKDAAYDCSECGHFTVSQRLWRLLHVYPERLRRAASLYIKERAGEAQTVRLDLDNFQAIAEGYLHRTT